MEDLKKRKLDEHGNGDFASKEELRLLLEPLAKPQLVDLLAKLCVSIFPIHFTPFLCNVFVIYGFHYLSLVFRLCSPFL